MMKKNIYQDAGSPYRRWGYLKAQIDPMSRIEPIAHPELELTPDSERAHWEKIYCQHIGAEFMHMRHADRCAWVAERMEQEASAVNQEFILKRILSAEIFERFIHGRYIGAKRFSLEGTAAVIPLLDYILDRAAERGFELVMLGMAHRGRLNALHHITHTKAASLLAEFEDVDPRGSLGGGDVKYHKGASGLYQTLNGKELDVHIASNPSHLEAVNPVIMGRARARQERIGDIDKSRVLAILIHGDAAFAGQGIVSECLNFEDLPGFTIGGVVHLIINNLIGFTATPQSLHSTIFASEAMKRIPTPIFHVNGEQLDDVARVGQMAVDYRSDFSSDVLIDLIGFRRFGHSEVDDPTITLPVLYEKIKNHPTLYQIYAKQIGITEERVKELEDEVLASLNDEQEIAQSMEKRAAFAHMPDYWTPFFGGPHMKDFEVDTAVPSEEIERITQRLVTAPEGFNVHPKVKRGFDQRAEMGLGKRPIDWGMAEALSFGSLLSQGVPVRITGQDSRRGTFNHRQAVLVDTENQQPYFPLCNVAENQARFDVYDSMLSELAAVGFEYGFSRDYPESLVCWEAQFGDFANGAQIITDQFLAAGEDKWGLLSGLVLLLPHGFEGQGPEHSSARIERYLQLAAEDNMQVCQPTTSAQYFHLLRRQALRKWRKPLVVFTPKSMLRHPLSASSRDQLTSGRFFNALDDTETIENPSRVLICTGKIAHELRMERKKQNDSSTAIISIEQLYPFPEEEINQLIEKYSSAKHFLWVQEEPANMGALFFVRPRLKLVLGSKRRLGTVKRSASASPATGSPKAHALEQDAIIRLAFTKYQ